MLLPICSIGFLKLFHYYYKNNKQDVLKKCFSKYDLYWKFRFYSPHLTCKNSPQ